MAHRKWHSQRIDTEEEAAPLLEQAPLLPREPGSVIDCAKRFVLEDQARATRIEAANANAVPFRERRNPTAPVQDQLSLRAGLTPQQLDALATLEQFRWTLRYVRRPIFQTPIPIVFSPDDARFIVIEADGSINETPGFKLRP